MQAMGFINIEQNRIIKIFSVVSVVFLPPTLVASSYGMNFEFMPELKWSFGYPGAIIFMILAGLAPSLFQASQLAVKSGGWRCAYPPYDRTPSPTGRENHSPLRTRRWV